MPCMSIENIAQALQQIRTLAQDRPDLIEATDFLTGAISAGNITNSTGVAIGRNIRMVVNNLNLPAETVASCWNCEVLWPFPQSRPGPLQSS